MQAVTVEKALEEMMAYAETIDASSPQTVNIIDSGESFRQGDIYLVNITEMPEGKPTKQRQLAPGTTQGSRHIINGEALVIESKAGLTIKLADGTNSEIPSELLGPAFETKGECTVDHPEHGTAILPVGEIFRVVYQRRHAEEVKRVMD